MLHGLFIVSLFVTIGQLIKEKNEPIIPSEYWTNKDLIYKDKMSGISAKEFEENLHSGKYIVTEKYQEPYRNEKGKIIIQNCKLWREDLYKYGALQTKKWAKQGKYNL